MRFQLSTLRLLAPVGLTGLIVANVTATTAAQESGAIPRSLVVEEIQDGFVVKPSFKLTEVDDELGALAGLSIGQITDGRLFLGVGINWLVSESNHTDLAYGGGIIEWFSDPDARVKLSVGSLVGLGAATLDTAVSFGGGGFYGGRFSGHRFGRHGFDRFPGVSVVRFREEFFVFEPQTNVVFNATDWFRVGVGAGFRVIGAAGGFEDRLQGYTAQIAQHFGPL